MRATLALVGSLVLMVVIGFGISMDVEDLKFAVLDRDQSTISQNYVNNLAGSRYFIEMPPIQDYADLDRRMKSGELALAIEIPPGFGRDVLRGSRVAVGAWFDGAMPQRGETVKGYVQAMHQLWLVQQARATGRTAGQPGQPGNPLSLQPRCEKPARHGAGRDSAAADDAAGHAHGPGRGARRSWAPS